MFIISHLRKGLLRREPGANMEIARRRALIMPLVQNCKDLEMRKTTNTYEGSFHEKVAVLLDFVQKRRRGGREGPAQIFSPLFTNCMFGRFWEGEEGGGGPLPNFFGTWALKKVIQVVQMGGSQGNLDKIQSFFS